VEQLVHHVLARACRPHGRGALAQGRPQRPAQGFGEDVLQVLEAVGERNAREWRLKLSLILRVTDTDKLRRTLRKVFGA